MATYKGIQGYRVESLASDPPTAIGQGQLWYNSASNVWKIGTVGAGAWSAGGNTNTGRNQASGAGFGTQTAAILAGGNVPPITLVTEQYNGVAWTELSSPSNLTYTAYTRMSGASGTTTAGVMFGGNPGVSPPWATADTEEWNGSIWTESGNMNTTKRLGVGAGSQTAALSSGGYDYDASTTAESEEYNGTGWTVIPGGDLNTSPWFNGGGTGTQTAAIMCGGEPGAKTGTETYDGATWSTSPATLNNGRNNNAMFGSTTAAICVGGDPSPLRPAVESFNGTSWTTVASSPTQAYASGVAGTQSLGLKMAGGAPPFQSTEEWDNAPEAIQTVTTS